MKQTDSGLVLPVDSQPKTPERELGPLEIQDPEQREKAANCLLAIWNAIGLQHPSGGIQLPDRPSKAALELQRAHYYLFAQALLGEDAPEGEQLT